MLQVPSSTAVHSDPWSRLWASAMPSSNGQELILHRFHPLGMLIPGEEKQMPTGGRHRQTSPETALESSSLVHKRDREGRLTLLCLSCLLLIAKEDVGTMASIKNLTFQMPSLVLVSVLNV